MPATSSRTGKPMPRRKRSWAKSARAFFLSRTMPSTASAPSPTGCARRSSTGASAPSARRRTSPTSRSRVSQSWPPRSTKLASPKIAGGNMRSFKLVLGALAGCALALSGPAVNAQSWPAKPVAMVNPFAPGGGVDAFGRPLSVLLSKNLGQQFLVENLAGAGGTIGAANAAKRPADGYNFFLGAVHHTIAESLYTKLPYSLERDFVPITVLAYVPNVVVVHPKHAGINTLKDLDRKSVV